MSFISFFKACIYDLCVLGGKRSALEPSVTAYASRCTRDNVIFPCDWRQVLKLGKSITAGLKQQ